MTTAYLTHPDYVLHQVPHHPESAQRMYAIWTMLKQTGLLDKLVSITPTPVTDEQIYAVHTSAYLDLLKQGEQEEYALEFDGDTLAMPETLRVARLSAGGVVDAVTAVLTGQADNALAVTRPPGHHAIPDRAMGFCFLNNVAIAVRHAQAIYGLERVLIVDYDVHHGNGTQDIFYDDPSVLFISTHQSPLYPHTGEIHQTGIAHNIVNIPLPPRCGDAEYAQVFQEIVWQSAQRFQPQLIVVSAGFDAHPHDHIAHMNLSLKGYDHITRELIQMANTLCDGKIVFATEGGYHVDVLAQGVYNIAHALLGENRVSDPYRIDPSHVDIDALVQKIKAIHQLK
jgi:acetoin utilization deacetylase AcuC-like enzyme